MVSDHLLRYRMMSDDELTAEKARLTLLNSGFASQALGTKNWTIALGQVMDQLNAVAFVMRERGYTVITPSRLNPNIGTVDFSGVSDAGCPNPRGPGSFS